MGWSIEQAARAIHVDPGTWRNWEQGEMILYRQHQTIIGRMNSFGMFSRLETSRTAIL